MKTELERGRTRRILIRAETCPVDGKRWEDGRRAWQLESACKKKKKRKKKKEEERKKDFKKFAYLSSIKKSREKKKERNTQVDDAIDTFERIIFRKSIHFRKDSFSFFFLFSFFDRGIRKKEGKKVF